MRPALTTGREAVATRSEYALPSSAPAGGWWLWDSTILTLIIGGIVVAGYLLLLGDVFDPLIEAVERGRVGTLAVRPSVLWAGMGFLLLVLRTVLWLRYRPAAAATFDSAPSITVIIPAYNEGPMVARSIDSAATASYPRERLQILVVDDGSTDDTWKHIEAAAARHPGQVRTIRFDSNRGKREALAAGFRAGSGEVFVTMDSDSVIEADALLAIAGPFRDPRVGAVAGKVVVLNRDEGLIPRMLHVRFILSFDFLRSGQSTFRSVYCTPGALSAYRAQGVRRVLRGWLEQRFLGVQCTYGEDRALTNDLMAQGYDAVYQSRAVVHTMVPTTYGQLCRMFLRWERSYVREELRFARIVWRRPPLIRLLAIVEKTATNLRLPVAYASLALLVVLSFEDIQTLFRVLFAIGAVSAFHMFYYLRIERSWQFVYGILYSYFAVFALWWILPFAALTVRARGWLTR